MSLHAPAEIRLINNIVVHFGYLPTEQAVTEVADHVRQVLGPADEATAARARRLGDKGSRTGGGGRGGTAAVTGCLTTG